MFSECHLPFIIFVVNETPSGKKMPPGVSFQQMVYEAQHSGSFIK
jgi:hypothetical protein